MNNFEETFRTIAKLPGVASVHMRYDVEGLAIVNLENGLWIKVNLDEIQKIQAIGGIIAEDVDSVVGSLAVLAGIRFT